MGNENSIQKYKKIKNKNLLTFDDKESISLITITERIKRLREKKYMLEHSKSLDDLYFIEEDEEYEEEQIKLRNYLDFYQ